MPLSEDFLNELFDMERTVASSKLLALSSLSDGEVGAFTRSWAGASEAARSKLIDRLTEIAEDNAEPDFTSIFRLALEDAAPDIRASAIDALWECRERWLLNRLAAMSKEDLAAEVRAAAAGALGKFVLLGALEELRPSLIEQVEGVLRQIIENRAEVVGVRRRAIEALAPSADPGVNDVIRDAYYSDERELKLSALFAMGQHCDEGWLPVLLSELKNTDAAMRFEAARACGELEDERAVTSLVPLLQEPDAEVQEAAIEALGRIGGAEAKVALKRCVAGSDSRAREAARAALEELSINENPLNFG